MAIGTYPELVTAINDWLLRNGDDIFAARIPNLIALHEATLDKTLRCKLMEAELDIDTVTEDRVLWNAESAVLWDGGSGSSGGAFTVAAGGLTSLPDDFLEGRSLTLLGPGGGELAQFSPEALDAAFIDRSAGRPEAYTFWGNRIRLGPDPDKTYALRLRYYKKVPRLTAAAPVNAFLTAYPDLYMYGALLQAAPTLKDQAAVPLWREAYETAMGLANDAAQRTLVNNTRARRRYGSLS
jgi:hypothetical protein